MNEKLRLHQQQPFEALQRILTRHQSAVDGSGTGCHERGAEILLWDGSVKKVEDLRVGEKLCGPDNRPRTVMRLYSGAGQMVRVLPVKGNPFVVNADHMLTLKRIANKGEPERIFDISVKEWQQLGKTEKHLSKLIRVPVRHWKPATLSLDPYSVGVLLGDGHLQKQMLSVTKPGNVIMSWAHDLADRFACRVVEVMRSANNPSYVFRQNDRLWEALLQSKIAGMRSGNKQVPAAYKTGDWGQRSLLLAGLLDTDGSLSCGGFDFISKSQLLALDVAFLARSLGLAAYVKSCQKFCQTGGGGTYWRVSISGDCSVLPARIKQASPRNQRKSVLHTGFSVQFLGHGEFFGFSLDCDGRYLMADFTITHNTGKTYVGAAVASSLRSPCLVIGPKVARSAWARAAEHFSDKFSYCNYELLRTGGTDFGKWDKHKKAVSYFVCECCQLEVDLQKFQPCPVHPQGIHCLNTKKRPAQYGNFHFHPAVKFLIFDECHRASGMDSLNAEMVVAAKRQNIKSLFLSATLAQSPLHFRAVGYALDLHNDKKDLEVLRGGQLIEKPSFTKWMSQHKVRWDQRFRGYKWLVGEAEQARIMKSIRAEIFPARGVRVRPEDIPGFPERVIQVETYTLDAPEKIDGCYQVMAPALARLKEAAMTDKNPESALTKILRQRQEIELLKVPAAAELMQDDLDKGFSVAAFVNFSATIEELKKYFPDAGIIDGTPSGVRNRDSIVSQYQENELRSLLINAQAGGVSLSLQDLDGFHPRYGTVFPSFSAVDLIQCLGRFQRDSGLSRCYYRLLYAAGTIEAKIARAVQQKSNCIEKLNDGDLMP